MPQIYQRVEAPSSVVSAISVSFSFHLTRWILRYLSAENSLQYNNGKLRSMSTNCWQLRPCNPTTLILIRARCIRLNHFSADTNWWSDCGIPSRFAAMWGVSNDLSYGMISNSNNINIQSQQQSNILSNSPISPETLSIKATSSKTLGQGYRSTTPPMTKR